MNQTMSYNHYKVSMISVKIRHICRVWYHSDGGMLPFRPWYGTTQAVSFISKLRTLASLHYFNNSNLLSV